MREKTASELWAAVTDDGEVAYSRGGSSSSSRLLIYETRNKVEAAIKNGWTQQVWKIGTLRPVKIFVAPAGEDEYMSEILVLPGYGVNAKDIYLPVRSIIHFHLIDFNGNYGTEIALTEGKTARAGMWPDDLKKRIEQAAGEDE